MSALASAEAKPGRLRILANGDAALVVEFGDRIEMTLSARVLALGDKIAEARIDGVVETVPTFRSLLVAFDPSRIAFDVLAERVSALADGAERRTAAGRLWRIPVCYDPEVAPDLAEAADRAGLTPEAFVARHSGATYHVYMLGFLPGQPYLGDLPEALALPRRRTPRIKVAAGSVGVAGRMTCLFPKQTPCGLNIIGRTPVALWDLERTDAALLRPGDRVAFEPIGLDELTRLQSLVQRGQWTLLPSLVASTDGTAS
jgi:KipI family sensor histidine kinase inhibitor